VLTLSRRTPWDTPDTTCVVEDASDIDRAVEVVGTLVGDLVPPDPAKEAERNERRMTYWRGRADELALGKVSLCSGSGLAWDRRLSPGAKWSADKSFRRRRFQVPGFDHDIGIKIGDCYLVEGSPYVGSPYAEHPRVRSDDFPSLAELAHKWFAFLSQSGGSLAFGQWSPHFPGATIRVEILSPGLARGLYPDATFPQLVDVPPKGPSRYMKRRMKLRAFVAERMAESDESVATDLREKGWPAKIDHRSSEGKVYAWRAILKKCPRARIEYLGGMPDQAPVLDLIFDVLRPGSHGFVSGHSEHDVLARAWMSLCGKERS